MNTENKNNPMVMDVILTLILFFGVAPFATMLMWNILVGHFFPVATVGYGGAFAIMLIRWFFISRPVTVSDDPETSLKETKLALSKSILTATATLVVGYFIGAI